MPPPTSETPSRSGSWYVERGLLAVLGLVGILVFWQRFEQHQPLSRSPLQIDRTEAGYVAIAHLKELGYHVADAEVENVSLRTDHAWSAFLQTEVQAAEELIAFRPPVWWEVFLSHPSRSAPIRVRVAPDGSVFRIAHPTVPGASGVRLDETQARAMATTFVEQVAGQPLDGWTLVESRVDQLTARSDHTLLWSRPMPGAEDSRQFLRLVIAGDEVASWSRTVELSDEFQARFQPVETLHTLWDFGILILVTLVWVAALIIFALRFRSSEIGVRNGFLMAFAVLVLFSWWTFNVAPYIMHSTFSDAEGNFTAAFALVGISLQVFFTSLAVFFVWNAGESVSREAWPSKLATFDKLFAQRLFTRDVGSGILRGASLAGITLGVWYVLLPLVAGNQWTVVGQQDLYLMSAVFPHGFAVPTAIIDAVLGTTYAFLFVLGLLKLRLKRTWVAMAITAVLFGTFFSETTVVLDRRIGAALSVVTGVAGYLFFARYDLWTVFCGFLFIGLSKVTATYLLHPAFETAGLITLTAGLTVLAYGTYAVFRGEQVDDKAFAPKYVRFISERERLKLELDIARQAQLRMLPARVPEPAGLEVAAFSEPAREVGGDYYDFLEFDDDRLGIVVGDVSGKGMPAALYMTMLKGFLQSRSESDQSPLSVLAHVNRMFGQSSDRSMFATLVYALLDVRKRQLRFARAGHCPLLVVRRSDASVYVLQPPGIGIGLERTDLFERFTTEETLEIQGDDLLILYSDGLTEARDPAGNEFGRQRLIDLVRAQEGSAESVLSAIRGAHAAFVSGQEPHDDLTCVVIRIVPDSPAA
ncbi:MAG: PP2C family protein-serine/threonine phosphatase [Rhodothermales bacterium]|nr:PP2C family protein-serine/threonine phosphatase [Rhodothermales bacterium]MBO6781359.1 PP2C family protein-serine/threonine phosphatase [Rhodothermales bacterium]